MNATQLLFRSSLAAVLFLLLPAAAQTLPAHYRQTNNIPYVAGGGHRQWLDLYHVPGATSPTPVVVWVHGGGWRSGNEDFSRALALTNHNIAVAAISYRYTTNQNAPSYPANVPHPAQIQDVKSALRWLRANAVQFNLDPARIGIWGQSAGGHLAALAGTTGHTNLFDTGENLGQSSRVQAVVDMSGPTDISLVGTSQPGDDVTLLLGGQVQNNPPTLTTVNPINFVRGDAPPFRLVHGESDTTVGIVASALLHTALTNAGAPSTFIRLPGTGHTIPSSQDAPAAQWLADTLNSVGVTNPPVSNTLPAHYRQTNNIPYVTGGQHRQWLDLYHVPGATNPTPVVVWVHGGGWLTGDENFPRALALTNHNVAVAAISYRYTTNQNAPSYPANVPHPAQIQDVKSAIRWLRANAAQFNLDPARIGIWGYSAGGHLAALAGTTGHTNLFDVGENLGQSSRVQAVAGMSGPANLGLTTVNAQTAGFFTLLLGAPAASNPLTLATVNPAAHLRADAPPFLLIHGETDPEVVIAHSESLHTALTNAGVSSLFVRLPGVGHTIPASQDSLTAQWLATNLNAVLVTNPPPADTLRAHEPFAAAAGTFLHGQNGGSGFVSAWAVLGFDSNANQFRNASAAPLAFGNLLASGSYVVGGYNNFTANRRLDVAGAFASHAVVGSNPAVIGRDGTTLWLSALVRKDSNDDVQLAVSLANADDLSNVNNLRVGMGYYGTPSNSGGQRFWSLLVNNPGADNFTFVPSNVPITNGVATLLVMRIQFGATDQIDLFVNPPLGGAAPVTPNATRSTTGGANLLLRTVAFWSSANQNNAALDELRLGDTFAAVTPTSVPVSAPGSLQFSAASYSVAENAGTASLTVTRAGGSTGAVGVSFATSTGSATAGSDYTATSGTLSWANGDSANKTFSVTILDDLTVEAAETVNLSLSNPTGGATLGSLASAVLTLANDDAPPFTDDLAVLSDEFTSASTLTNYQRVIHAEGWNADHLESLDINSARAGRMTMVPHTGGWFNDYIGELTFKPVTGDFVLTTEVIPRNRAGTGAPSGEYSLAGIMVRTPTAHTTGATGWPLGQQNFVFLSMGSANNPSTYQFEVKTTLNSVSTLYISNAPSSQTELQIARIGGALITLRRDLGGQWLVHRRFTRGDFPATLQAGLVAYTDWQGMQARFPINQPGSYLGHNSTVITDQNPGLRAEFEYLRFHRPQVPASLVGRDFANPAQVSDAELLAFLGANANAPATNAPVNITPAFTLHPPSQTLIAGTNCTFAVTATGTAPLSYQWLRNTAPLPSATNATLTLAVVTRTNSGSYTVQVTGPGGTATSLPATLRVLNFPRLHPPQHLPGGAVRLHFNDHDGGPLALRDMPNFEVWVGTNLIATNWVRLNLPLTVTNGLLTLDDPAAAQHPRRFYRVLER